MHFNLTSHNNNRKAQSWVQKIYTKYILCNKSCVAIYPKVTYQFDQSVLKVQGDWKHNEHHIIELVWKIKI